MKFKFKVSKIDVVTIVLLCIVFFSIAVMNLGLTQTPSTTAQVYGSESFYVDLGSQVNVKSVIVLLKQGAMNLTVSGGVVGNWNNNSAVLATPTSGSGFSEDYYKWFELSCPQTTQYLEFNVTQAGTASTKLCEIAVIGQDNQQIPIQAINSLLGNNPDLHYLIDEQNKVSYPADYMSQTYFDEIYFVRTAEQYLHLQMPYEWTHPPMGKLIQAVGIVAFGFDPFGWRIMGVIFATLMIALVYLLGKELLGSWIGGFAAAFLLTFDFMHFTMGRMGTADTYVVFFNVASQLCFFIYLRNVVKDGWKTSVLPLFLSFVFFALGFSSKWLVLYGFVGELAILILLRLNDLRKVKGWSAKFYGFLERPYSWVVAFILIAVGIYFATYIPDMLAGRSLMDVLDLQGSMYVYHSTLTATHPFSSPWYSWPLMLDPLNGGVHVPLWLQIAQPLTNGTESTIVLMGNIALWWFGFACILALTIIYVPKVFQKTFQLKENLPALFLIVVFFTQWLPYMLISRVVFIYHFYVNVPIICLASAFLINEYWNKKAGKVVAIVLFAIVVALFVIFYPAISGVPTDPATINGLKWFGSWVF